MTFTDEEIAAVRSHVKRMEGLPGGFMCPLCRGTDWMIEGLVREGVLDRAQMYAAVLSCDRCHFLCHFQFQPLVDALLEEQKASQVAAEKDAELPKLPAFCGACGAAVKAPEVDRSTPTVRCPRCGAALDVP
jgi:hypothetical protein